MIILTFLYYRGAPYTQRILEALRTFNLNVKEIEANSEIVSNLVPNALKRGAESWLIFFLPDRQQELLILPFPDDNHLQDLGNPPSFRNYLANLIPVVNEYLKPTRDNFHASLEWIGRFEYIRLNSSLFDEVSDTRRSESEGQVIQETLLETSQNVQQQRSKVLSEALRFGRPVLLNKLDEGFLTELHGIFSYLQTTHGAVEVVPDIVKDFEEIMDDETKRFLISSETVREFADDLLPDNFDYSLPGCGLWKAVERELNLSLVLHLRTEWDIANIDSPWVGLRSPKYTIRIAKGTVNLNIRETENSCKLRGLMLSEIKDILRVGSNNEVKKALEMLCLSNAVLLYLLGSRSTIALTENTLPWHLKKLGELRNSHAHISAMSREQFNELRKLVLPDSSDPETCLVKILQLKEKVFRYRSISRLIEVFKGVT